MTAVLECDTLLPTVEVSVLPEIGERASQWFYSVLFCTGSSCSVARKLEPGWGSAALLATYAWCLVAKPSASRGAVTANLLSHLSHMAFDIHTKEQQGRAGFMASLVGRAPKPSERLHLGSAWVPAPPLELQSDGESRAPVSLSTCHYIPGRVWHFAVVDSLVAEKLARPPCQGYRQPNTPCLPPPDSLSL